MLATVTASSSANCNVNNNHAPTLLRSGSDPYHDRMKPESWQSAILLPTQVLWLRVAAGTIVSCAAGTLWVTQEGVLSDDFLTAGESLRIVSAGLTLVEAVGGGDARLRLLHACVAQSLFCIRGPHAGLRGVRPSSYL